MEFINEIANKIHAEFSAKKEIILKEKLAENGIVIDWEQEEKKRFKSLAVTHSYDRETWYYNDGSIDGLRIVTFVNDLDMPGLNDFNDGQVKISAEIKYY